MITLQCIADTARGYIDVPFSVTGRNKHGVDCSGLVACVAEELGLFNCNYQDYGINVDPNIMIGKLDDLLDKGNYPCIFELGDIILFNIVGEPRHLGIVTCVGDTPLFVHAYYTMGRVVENRLDNHWQRRICAIYKWKGVSK